MTNVSDAEDNGYTQRLDAATKPQDDFFAYVNGRWLKQHPIPASESSWGVFNVLQDEARRNMREMYESLEHRATASAGTIEQQARDLYYTAMHADQFEQLHLTIVAEHIAKIQAVADTSQLATCIGELQSIGVNAPWDVVVDTDDKDSRKHLLRVGQAGLTLPDRDYYMKNTPEMVTVRKKYATHISKVLTYIPDLHDGSDNFQKTVASFEHKLAEHSRPSAALREVEQNYHKTTFAKLQHEYPNIDWRAYAGALGWQPSNQISVDQPEFLSFINERFAETTLAEWRIYLKWQFAATYCSKISERFAALHFEFFGKTLSGTEKILPRWKRAVLTIDHLIGPGVGRLYAEKYFPEGSKHQVLDLVETIRSVYRRRLERLDWMSVATKAHALKKLASIKVLVGYPDKWRDFSLLEINRASFIANVMAAEKFQTQYYLRRLREPTSRDDWFMNPQTVNAYNDPGRLVICFPAAILQPPFFDSTALAVVNLAGIGTVIGHEFTHGFDDQGYKFDEWGNMRVWQTPQDRAQFAKRAKAIIEQANEFTVLPGLNLQGELIVGESIADLGGVEIAYEAFLALPPAKRQGTSALAAAQLFFVAYAATECMAVREEKKREYALADPHPDSEFRVNGTLAHVDGFYAAFGVTAADKLYRPANKRAKIW